LARGGRLHFGHHPNEFNAAPHTCIYFSRGILMGAYIIYIFFGVWCDLWWICRGRHRSLPSSHRAAISPSSNLRNSLRHTRKLARHANQNSLLFLFLFFLDFLFFCREKLYYSWFYRSRCVWYFQSDGNLKLSKNSWRSLS